MRSTLLLVLGVILGLLAGGAARAAGQQDAEIPPGSPAAQTAGLAALAADLQARLARGDLAGFLELWTPDALDLEPFRPVRAGRAEVGDAWGPLVAAGRCACRVRVVEVEDTGPWAWVRVRLEGVVEEPGERPTAIDDQLLLVARPSPEGGWRIARASRTPVQPTAPAPGAGRTVPSGVEVLRDVVYSAPGGFELRMDLHHPRSARGALPAVVLVHGGGWGRGSRTTLEPLAADLAARGYVAAAIEYRLSGEAPFPAAVSDARAAVRWLRADAERLGVDPEAIAVAGAAAGAQIAALVAFTDRLGGETPPPGPGVPARVRAAALLSPPADLVAVGRGYPEPRELHRDLFYYLGAPYSEAPDTWAAASPVSHVTGDAPPVLLLHGSEDAVIPPDQSLSLLRRLVEAGVYADLFTVRGGGHDFYLEPAWHEVIVEKLDTFLRRALDGGVAEDVPEAR